MSTHNLVPIPLHCELTGGSCHIGSDIQVCVDDSDAAGSVGSFLAEEIRTRIGFAPEVSGGCLSDTNTSVALSIETDAARTHGAEGYELVCNEQGVTIRAGSHAGLFYGVQTLLQLLPEAHERRDDVEIPALRIVDRPRYQWRGMHLDVCRHFFGVEQVKKYLDLLALHKMNRFHWHLTEDQGWRVEIKNYPRLTEVGAWRTEADGSHYGGFYSQDDVREVIRYATERCVTVVPEIEMPGHALAALAAYPELSCTGGPFEVASKWGVFDDVYCAGKEETFAFIENVLGEVFDLFPGEYVHIGGDEVPKARWQAHDLCQQRMANEALADASELQSYFLRRIGHFLTSVGKRMIGWDEILEGGLPPESIVMSWRGAEGGIAAARGGHDVVMSPMSHCYFDFYQAEDGEPKAIGGYLPLETVYAFEPKPSELSPEEAVHILGGQGNVWTEYMADWSHVEYMALPRMCAMAEALWSMSDRRDYGDFRLRMQTHRRRLDRQHVDYRPGDLL